MPSHNSIENSKLNIRGNFQQGDNYYLGIPEPLSTRSDYVRYSLKDRNESIIKRINQMTSEELAQEFTSHVIGIIRKNKRRGKELVDFDEDLQSWVILMFCETESELKSTFLNLQEDPDHIFHKRRVIIDIEEFLHYEPEQVNHLKDLLIKISLVGI